MQWYCIDVGEAVKTPNPARPPRTRRAEKAERTRQQIQEAAQALFLSRGYASTTMDAIARHADVAVETVYARFRNKIALLEAILEPAIVGTDDGRDIFDLPEIAHIRQTTDQRVQIGLLAAFSRGILERTHAAHRILASAAAVDPKAADLQRRDTSRRVGGQRRYIDMLTLHRPLRAGLTYDEAAATYSTLANPSTYSLLTGDLGWSADDFQAWLETTLARLLLEDSSARTHFPGPLDPR
ncbi:MAG TPA: TetR family transcriptional regulator [Mycobacteriales bacterium]|jgi:AcrR family transcriptional regulator|nr:TetR family transcriptional regulator [Mycobacteriales bacterium]